MTTAYIHIGTEKTGTSTIQQFFNINRSILLEKISLLYPKSPGDTNHRKLSAYALIDDRYDDFHMLNNLKTIKEKKDFEIKFKQEFIKELSQFSKVKANAKKILISSEHFHSRLVNIEELQKLKSLLEPYVNEFKIIVYLRPQIEVVTSHYSTALKNGSQLDFEDFINKNCLVENYYYDYEALLNRWETVFGSNAMIVRIFSKKSFDGQDLITDFLNILDYPSLTHELHSVNNENESINVMGQLLYLELNRNINWFIEGVGENHKHRQISKLITSMFKGTGQLPTKENAKSIQAKFDEINSRVHYKYFPNKEILFDIDYSRYPIKKIDHDEYVIQFLSQILKLYSLDSSKPETLEVILRKDIDNLRNLAMNLESVNLKASYEIMKFCQKIRPQGGLINKKINQYKGLLSDAQNKQ